MVADERPDAPDADIAVRFDGVRLHGGRRVDPGARAHRCAGRVLVQRRAVERVSILEDDAFYYLGVARSLAEGHGSTFAGSIMTNGYHPLWLALLVPVTWLVQDAELLVLAVLVVHGVLWAASVRETFRIGRAVGSWHGAAPRSGLRHPGRHDGPPGLQRHGVRARPVFVPGPDAPRGHQRARPEHARRPPHGRRPRADLPDPPGRGLGAVPIALVLLFDARRSGRALVRRAVALGSPTAVALAATG